MNYGYRDKQSIQDTIYKNRLKLINLTKFNYLKTAQRYSYFIKAYLGRLYC